MNLSVILKDAHTYGEIILTEDADEFIVSDALVDKIFNFMAITAERADDIEDFIFTDVMGEGDRDAAEVLYSTLMLSVDHIDELRKLAVRRIIKYYHLEDLQKWDRENRGK